MKISLFKKKKINYEKVEKGISFKPNHAWKVMFSMFLFVIVLTLAFSIYLFWASLQADVHSPDINQGPILPKVNKTELERLSKYYSDKQTKYDTMHEKSPEIVDPGI